MSDYSVFTSESVSEGHPDKMADQISDAVLDAMIAQDAESRVACEVLLKDELIVVAGEFRSNAQVDIDAVARGVIDEVGYGDPASGYDLASARVLNVMGQQSREIAEGVDETPDHEQGAGDQGLMFGYATDETDVLMPAPITFAHRLMRRHAEVRRSHLKFLRPDAKSQLTFRYDDDGIPVAVDAIVVSTQHSQSVDNPTLHEAVMEEIIKPVIPGNWITADTKTLINPAGRFETGGPVADCGLTGRKIIVDTYGGMARHGGGAFSGKDPTKVDRSANYAARWVAKNVVAAGLARRFELQLAYVIGKAKPVSVNIETFGTGAVPDSKIEAAVREVFDLRPGVIIRDLNLRRPLYRQVAAYGHFGRDDLADVPWEQTNRAADLARLCAVGATAG